MSAIDQRIESEILSQEMLEYLTRNIDFTLPDIDWDDAQWTFPDELLELLKNTPEKLTNETLTERVPGGNGTFDAIMESLSKHLLVEYKNNRITGAEYTKAYIALTQIGLQQAVSYLVQRDKSFWDALNSQVAAYVASVQLQNAKAQYELYKIQALTAKAQYAASVAQLAQIDGQTGLVQEQKNLVTEQIETQKEQTEQVRSQTLDDRRDGTTVVGYVGKQKDLYSQQIVSYKRDSELNAAKVFSDAWITQKTIDEGLTAPTLLQNASVNRILTVIRNNNDLLTGEEDDDDDDSSG